MIQIVIDIPEKIYIHLHDGGSIGASLMIENAIKNGTPLPKGHGDLIDREGLLDEMFDKCGTECCCCEHFIINKKGCRDDCGLIFNAPTIIEANKEEE